MSQFCVECPSPEDLDELLDNLWAIKKAQNLHNDYEAVQFLLKFYKCFNQLLLRGECTQINFMYPRSMQQILDNLNNE